MIRTHCLILGIILGLQIFTPNLFGQIKNIGHPFITSFTRNEYKAETQNWSITQDTEGAMYFANNLGVLTLNGNNWNVFSLPNASIVRSVAYFNDRIYAGGFNEFGYFKKNDFGTLEYFSLSKELSENYKSFDEIWRIHEVEGAIIFQSYLDIFIYTNNQLTVLEPKSKFGFSYKINNTLYVVDREFGLYSIAEKKLVPIYLHETFFNQNEITFIAEKKADELLIGTTNNGIYLLKNNKLIQWELAINNELIANQIYTGIKINSDQLAIGTIQNGIYIVDFEGNIVMHLNRLKGLQNNTVLSLFYDMHQNLWLGLDNGIAMLEINSPMSILNFSHNIETSYCNIVHNGILYVGTNQGLFGKPLNQLNNQKLDQIGFQKVKGNLGQVWTLKVMDDQLFCGHNFGTYIIDKFDSKILNETPGGWDYLKIPWNQDYIIGGTYSGITLYQKNKNTNQWIDLGFITGINESCRVMAFDNNKNLWISHGIKGLFGVKLSDDLKSVSKLKTYNAENGLDNLPYVICMIDKKPLVLSNNKLFEFNNSTDRFFVNNEYSQLIADFKNVTKIIEDVNGDLWVFTSNTLAVLRAQEDGKYTKITKPFLRIDQLFLKGSFENIYTLDRNTTLIGSQEGLLHYSSNSSKNFEEPFKTYIGNIHITSRDVGENNIPLRNSHILSVTKKNATLSYKYNTIKFEFYTPFFEGINETKHSYRLLGFENTWSEWSNSNNKEFTNLHEGKYIFEVRAKNIYSNISTESRFSFIIKPPFYRSKIAYTFYTLLILLIVLFNLIYFRTKIEKARKIEKEKLAHAEKEFKQEAKLSEEKIEQLEKDNLKGEMRLKNIELANSTMNLIHKNKLLSYVKKELLSVSGKAQSNYVKEDIKELIKRIEKEINNDQNLKIFDKYFDRVHQDFVNRIKEQHPTLTAKDLRLCAYLRMNLSTKEIAPLLNVSTRGLEISRYRLRRKLNLDHDDNLVEYIMGI